MPQLDHVTFLSQYFWLCVFYLGFYYILLKHFLPKISRILAVRKQKLHSSNQGIDSVTQENHEIRTHCDQVVGNTLTTSKNLFENFLSETDQWVNTTTKSLNQTHYRSLNKSYINLVGEISLSQNLVVYHASQNLPEKVAVKSLLDKLKSLKFRDSV